MKLSDDEPRVSYEAICQDWYESQPDPTEWLNHPWVNLFFQQHIYDVIMKTKVSTLANMFHECCGKSSYQRQCTSFQLSFLANDLLGRYYVST